MNKLSIVCIILAVLMFVIVIVYFWMGYGIEYKALPCVDGDGDINLEGIMCDKSYETFYGEQNRNGIGWFFLGMFSSAIIFAYGIIRHLKKKGY